MSIQIVPIEATVTMTATANIRHMCPFVQEIDNGTITVTWEADGWTIELHSLRAYLRTFRDRKISHEELTEEIRAEINSHHGINTKLVTTTWDTAGMEITCATLPTRQPNESETP